MINGTEATIGGNPNYPSITLNYSMNICNYNDFDMIFKRANDSKESSSFMKFWYPDSSSSFGKKYIANKEMCDAAAGDCGPIDVLKSKTCESISDSVSIDTVRSNYFMQAKMQGRLKDQNDGYCYAYAYEPITIDYDYGDGPCQMEVSASYATTIRCIVTNLFTNILFRLKSDVR